MFKKLSHILCLVSIFNVALALESSVPLQVWVNEAIINTYTFNDTNLIDRQKDMSQYFTAEAWKAYLDTLNRSNIITQVKENHFQVSAVATLPPKISAQTNTNTWKASMPVLVQYQGKSNTLKQNLEINLVIVKNDSANSRGYAILQYEAKVIDKPCNCAQAYYPKVTIV
jgi:intracellular multiplication protein IcmL